ncbi:MAG: hypothetical protein CM15mP73_1270 [Hyphomicrobiales bacterium]|nr:MAG: hypothetical protein CM15mP73_1270 [Hyphomicrobiales bacterium]
MIWLVAGGDDEFKLRAEKVAQRVFVSLKVKVGTNNVHEDIENPIRPKEFLIIIIRFQRMPTRVLIEATH